MKASSILFTCGGAAASPPPGVNLFVDEQILLLCGSAYQVVRGSCVHMEIEIDQQRWDELVRSGWVSVDD